MLTYVYYKLGLTWRYHFAEPKLKVSPLYFLKVPDDAVAHFKCECEILDTAACINNDMAWSVVDSTTGDKTIIYKNEQLLDKSGAYEILVSQNGSALNLTVNGKHDFIVLIPVLYRTEM